MGRACRQCDNLHPVVCVCRCMCGIFLFGRIWSLVALVCCMSGTIGGVYLAAFLGDSKDIVLLFKLKV